MPSYYSYRGSSGFNACSIASAEYPIIVNCAGDMRTSFSFTTDNPGGREDFYLLYVLKGSMKVPLDQAVHTAGPGTVLLFPPHYRYRYSYRGAEPLLYFFVHFTGSYAEQLLRECGFSPLPCLIQTKNQAQISEQFHRLFEEFETPEPFRKKILACVLEQLILTVAQSAYATKEEQPLERSMGMIHASYQQKLSIPMLAQLENLSNSHYIALFRQQNGVSPNAYIIGLRMQNACELLHNTDMSVKQIGIQVGYEDPFFFSKLFKRHMGMSPQKYRTASRTPQS